MQPYGRLMMKRLKALRAACNLTKQDVAAKLGTTRQTIARWECGKAAPSESALRDLATLYSTSVDDLLEAGPSSDKVAANANSSLQSSADGFWGHLGLLLPGKSKTSWYPIAEGEFRRIWRHLRNSDDDNWLVATTLNNRILAFRPARMKRVWLLDDACDAPEDDWDWKQLWNDYNGLPEEVYRAMGMWAWDQLEGSAEFSESIPKALQETASELIEEANLTDEPDQLLARLHNTSILLQTGDQYNYEVEPNKLWEATQAVIFEPSTMFYLPAAEGEFESFFSSDAVVLLDMPLLDVEDAVRHEWEEQKSAG